jgi:hypothetical protein
MNHRTVPRAPREGPLLDIIMPGLSLVVFVFMFFVGHLL